ncbi:MAG: chemotaxis-specific protein-glutamate methyltransferase CheB [Haloplanus sp.]
MAGQTRAVVVDDSRFMRTVVSDILEEGDVTVVAEASDGADAVEAVATHDPDVVTMDVEMPGVDGIEAVERIMASNPVPILMLSAHTDEDADVTFEALERGAVDFFTKPGGEVTAEMGRFREQLVAKAHSVAEADVGGDGGTHSATALDAGGVTSGSTVVIGASTGGPSVVEDVLADLPVDAALRVLIVQHMPASFTGRFADRLDDASAYDVFEPSDGAGLRPGEAAVAPGDGHLRVAEDRRDRVTLSVVDGDPVNGVRPAIDVTMRSAAATVSGPLTGVVLTGMGSDGAAGVEAIADAGGAVVAQDEATSAVYGMPERAAETGCVDAAVPAGDVPEAILDSFTDRR